MPQVAHMVECPSRSRGLFEKRLGLLEAINLDPKQAPMYTKPLPCPVGNVALNTLSLPLPPRPFSFLACATLLRATQTVKVPQALGKTGPASPWAAEITSLTSSLSPCKGQNTMSHKKLPHLGLARVLRRRKTPSFLILSTRLHQVHIGRSSL